MAGVLTLLSGNSNKGLAEGVAKALDGAPLGEVKVSKFANGETSVSVERSVREADVFIIQSGVGTIPTNDAVMELLILCNAARIASAQRVTIVAPYFPYAKHNKIKKRSAVPARMMADMMKVAGAMHVITIDLNPAQMAGFFQIPVDNIMIWPLLSQYITSHVPDYKTAVLVAKNAGASKRADKLANALKLDMAMIIDRSSEDDFEIPASPSRPRADSQGAKTSAELAFKSGNIIGRVKGRCCILVDDVLDDSEPFISAATALMKNGASNVIVMATHGLMSGGCPKALQDCPCISTVVVTNTVPQERHQVECPKLAVIRCDGVIAETIRRVHNDECMSSKFTTELEIA